MRKFRFVLTLSLLVLNLCLIGQNSINGIVVDENNNQRLAFVNIVVNDNGTLKVHMEDIESAVEDYMRDDYYANDYYFEILNLNEDDFEFENMSE